MPRLGDSRLPLIESLAGHYGRLRPPGDWLASLELEGVAFESLAAVALGLIVDARVAQAAWEALRSSGLLEPGALSRANPLELDDIFREARVRLKSQALRSLQKLAGWLLERDLDGAGLENLSTESIRDAWRPLNGVGPATADSWLLFGLGRPTYPVDRASYRIMVRHGWLDPSSDYDEARSTLEAIAPDDADALAQLSVGFEKLGRDACKPGTPRCETCPLRSLLPDGGPIEDS